MKRMHLGIVGFGSLGRACARAVMGDEQLTLSGIVRRTEKAGEALPAPFTQTPTASHISELGPVDGALVCVPTEHATGVARELLQAGVPVVECASLHGDAFGEHKRELDREASHYKVPAIVGAGWDPGALSVFRGLFALLTPHGHTETSRRPGVNLHHTTVAAALAGVREALSTELRDAAGKRQRYVYVELEEGADPQLVERAIRNDPLFAGEETLVFTVDSVAGLEEEGHGVLMERWGNAAGKAHQLFLLEARYSEPALSAQVMVSAAKALNGHGHRAYSLFDLPLGALWGDLRAAAEKEWL